MPCPVLFIASKVTLPLAPCLVTFNRGAQMETHLLASFGNDVFHNRTSWRSERRWLDFTSCWVLINLHYSKVGLAQTCSCLHLTTLSRQLFPELVSF